MSCKIALSFLRSFPAADLAAIQYLHIGARAMFSDDLNNVLYTADLATFIVENMAVNTVSLRVPLDPAHGYRDWLGIRPQAVMNLAEAIENARWNWRLHQLLTGAFRAGHFQELRFAHTKRYAGSGQVFTLRNMRVYIMPELVGGDQVLRELLQRKVYMEFLRSSEGGSPAELEAKMWKDEGYEFSWYHGDLGAGEEGSVAAVKRVGVFV